MKLHTIITEDMARIASVLGNQCRELEGRNVLITGGGGLLPSYMVYTLAYLNRNYFKIPCRVFVVTRTPAHKSQRLAAVAGEENFYFIEDDLLNLKDLPEPMDFIVHAASKASPIDYLADPIGTLEVNTFGLKMLLEHALRNNTRGVLFFSSGEIYGSPPLEQVPTSEEYPGLANCLNPRACYSESKRFGETICYCYAEKYGVPVKIVRPFQIFGPGISVQDKRAFPEFIYMAANKLPLVVKSAGTAQRTFCYLADATILFWQVLLMGKPAAAYNVGAQEPLVSILDLAKTIVEVAGPPVELVQNIDAGDKYLEGSPDVACPDISKVVALGGYSPRTSLLDVVRRTYLWAVACLAEQE